MLSIDIPYLLICVFASIGDRLAALIDNLILHVLESRTLFKKFFVVFDLPISVNLNLLQVAVEFIKLTGCLLTQFINLVLEVGKCSVHLGFESVAHIFHRRVMVALSDTLTNLFV